jgi:hypothetical protein
MNIQIQINEISNGFLVAMPPSEKVISRMMQQNIQPQPVVTFCKDYKEVCNTLKNNWPLTIEE